MTNEIDTLRDEVELLKNHVAHVQQTEGMRIVGDAGALFAALAKAQVEFPSIPRTKTVKVSMTTGGSYTFDYAPLDTILAACAPVLGANGLSVAQPFTVGTGGEFLLYTILAGHGARLETWVTLARAADIKAQGGNITYMRRYCYTAMVGVTAETDDDGNMASGDQREVFDRSRPAPKAAPRPASKPAEAKAVVVPDEKEAAKPVESAKSSEVQSVRQEMRDEALAEVGSDEPMTNLQSASIKGLCKAQRLPADEVRKLALSVVKKDLPSDSIKWSSADANSLIKALENRGKEKGIAQ